MKDERMELRIGGLILCGGKSSRMGRPKLSLPFGDETMLVRVCRIVSQAVKPIVVVAAVDQELPLLDSAVRIVRDEFPEQGPLAGLAVGLANLADDCDAAFVTACDSPLLRPDFIRKVIGLLGDFEAVVPVQGQFDQVLSACYRTSLGARARDLIAAGRRRPLFLIDECRSLRVPVDQFRDVDPNLDSLRNTNTPDEYQATLALAGLAATDAK